MSLTQGDPLPNIRTTKTVDTTGPDWYTEYLENLAKPGAALIGQSGADLVAPMSEMQTGVLGRAEEELGGYTGTLGDAAQTAELAAAKSAADGYSNLKVPSTVSEEAYAPIPGAYSTSPLAQIAGLGSLFASGAGGTSAVEGVLSNLPKFGTALGGLFSGLGAGGGGSSIDASGDGFSTETEYSPY